MSLLCYSLDNRGGLAVFNRPGTDNLITFFFAHLLTAQQLFTFKTSDDLFFLIRSPLSNFLPSKHLMTFFLLQLFQLRPAPAAQNRPAHRAFARCSGGPVHL